ncbi:MAG: hypothetical protein WBE09_00260 [Candidatus Acidiferrales bacterium]
MKAILNFVLSLALGFLGGLLAARLELRTQLRGTASAVRVPVVRAERFELVSASGNPLAYWGNDWQRGRVLMAFLDEKGRSRAEFGVAATRFGVGGGTDFTPFTALLASDGKIRLQAHLDKTQDPVLAMGDSNSEGRLLLGHSSNADTSGEQSDPWDKWSLILRDPSHGWKEYVDLGVTTPLDTKQRTGYLILRNSFNKKSHILPSN